MSSIQINDKNNKEFLDSRINQLVELGSGVSAMVEKINERYGLNHRTSNIGLVLSDKIDEMIGEFQNHGLSFFTIYIPEIDIESYHIVNEIIEGELFDRAKKALDDFYNYVTNYRNIHYTIYGPELDNKYFSVRQIKDGDNIHRDSELTSSEKSLLDDLHKKYEDSVSSVSSFSLEKDFVDCAIEYFKKQEYSYPNYVDNIINSEVIPILKQLGLGHLVDDLLKRLQEIGYNCTDKNKTIVTNNPNGLANDDNLSEILSTGAHQK